MSLLTVPSTVMLVGPRRMREAIAFGVALVKQRIGVDTFPHGMPR